MPIKKCQKDNKSGIKYGDFGTCYTGTKAREQALQQMKAIKASQTKQPKGK